MPHMSGVSQRFDEKILYKCHRHWIHLVFEILIFAATIALFFSFLIYFLSSYSWGWTSVSFVTIIFIYGMYRYYLWVHSWLLIGNQKVSLSVRNGVFSQYAMNVRYRNIRDCAVSKHSIWSFFFKYGSIFVRSSANEWDFHAHYVPKVGKVYALINALSRYSDEERAHMDSIEKLHEFHTKKEFAHIENEHETA